MDYKDEIEGSFKEKTEVEVININNYENNDKGKKVKKTKKGFGKSALAFCLIFGMIIGSTFSTFVLKDTIAEEVRNMVMAELSIPANTSNDNSLNQVNVDYSISNIVEDVTPSVVSIGILGSYSSNSLTGAGTGIIFEEDEEKVYIVTNNHVIEGASGVKVWIDGSEEAVDAKLVGTVSYTDIAVISVSKEDLATIGILEVTPCEFGDSDALRVGETVIAIGNAMGEGISTTGGMISIKNKTITENNGNEINVIQTDAPINPGNSGGALVNSKGEVIGINTAKRVQTFNSSVEGVGYAIPSNDVVDAIDEIINNSEKPVLGIKGFTIDAKTAELFSLPEMGVFVKDVIADGSAYNAGIQPNDVITSYNNQPVTDITNLQELIRASEVGDKVIVKVFREGEIVEITVTMQKHADVSF